MKDLRSMTDYQIERWVEASLFEKFFRAMLFCGGMIAAAAILWAVVYYAVAVAVAMAVCGAIIL